MGNANGSRMHAPAGAQTVHLGHVAMWSGAGGSTLEKCASWSVAAWLTYSCTGFALRLCALRVRSRLSALCPCTLAEIHSLSLGRVRITVACTPAGRLALRVEGGSGLRARTRYADGPCVVLCPLCRVVHCCLGIHDFDL